MSGVLTGFAVIAAVIGTGYVLGRFSLLGDGGREVLTKLAFHVASPALMFETLSQADLTVLASAPLAITALSAMAMAGGYALVGAARRWPAAPTTVGALCSGYVNAGNLGIPVAAYVLGDASLVAPVLLFQLLVMTPVGLTVLDVTTSGGGDSLPRRLTSPLRNPIVIGSLAGVTVAATGWRVPEPVMEPFHLIGAMSVPAVLLAFGISLYGSALPGRDGDRGPLVLSVLLKSLGQPLVAWALGAFVFGLAGRALFTVVVTAALPSAQNLFAYASRYGVATRLARESILISTVLAVPVLFTIAALLG
ncbi:AEC family transporter [Streptomyces reniochalinae]|uniref:AEC family transporter n=1 Tax=Streptomyces reniochalinae TaxID=2250578 RepID=A0A367F2X4_9ACTN|nr:AEC family transporter [Streptomyces reniochalinae]RCG23830.1 AEC family transporter [Streptomyces reniochalinae]